MTDSKGYDPFSDDEHVEPGETHAPVAKDDPLDELMTPSGIVPSAASSSPEDGWAPIEEESWKLPEPFEKVESPVQDTSAGVEPTTAMPTSSATVFDLPAHHNPLPDASPLTDADRVRVDRASEVRSAVRSGLRLGQPAPDSNEAILQSGVGSGAREATRNALPSQADAPLPPAANLLEPRPMAWVLPSVVFVSGVGAGVYVLLGHNPILGGIAIALSVVGSLFLRVFLKQ